MLLLIITEALILGSDMQGLFIKTDRICYQRTSIWPLAMTEMLLRCTGTWSKSSKLIIHEVKVILFMQHNHVIFGGGKNIYITLTYNAVIKINCIIYSNELLLYYLLTLKWRQMNVSMQWWGLTRINYWRSPAFVTRCFD